MLHKLRTPGRETWRSLEVVRLLKPELEAWREREIYSKSQSKQLPGQTRDRERQHPYWRLFPFKSFLSGKAQESPWWRSQRGACDTTFRVSIQTPSELVPHRNLSEHLGIANLSNLIQKLRYVISDRRRLWLLLRPQISRILQLDQLSIPWMLPATILESSSPHFMATPHRFLESTLQATLWLQRLSTSRLGNCKTSKLV
mmetsp:Transcript_23319/g.67515  ORF Transcript_23319/g.67515 Transcript_23319/m.67515 type:complete len:200 (-) Transcript_23319:933-1532(-)